MHIKWLLIPTSTIIVEILWKGYIISNSNRKCTTTIDRISWNLFFKSMLLLVLFTNLAEYNNPVSSGRNLLLYRSFCDFFKILRNQQLKHVLVLIFYYISRRSRENCLQKEINFYLLLLIAPEYPPTPTLNSCILPLVHYLHFFLVFQYCLKIYSPLLYQDKKTQMNPFTKAENTNTTKTNLLAKPSQKWCSCSQLMNISSHIDFDAMSGTGYNKNSFKLTKNSQIFSYINSIYIISSLIKIQCWHCGALSGNI